MSQSKLVQLNVDELKDYLEHMVSNNQYIQAQGKVPVTINIEGDSGLGKTSAIRQFADSKNMDVIRLNLAEFEELGDLVGFPLKEYLIENKEGKSAWVVDAQLETAVKSGYRVKDKRMSHAAPEWIQGKTEGGFLILDDYTRADHRFMQATMTLVEEQSYASWKLPKNWHIILTTNPDNGDYNVTSLDNAQRTRFVSVELKFDVNVWARWAEANNIDGRCINFLLMHPELVTETINPRSITLFFNSISSLPKFEDSLPLIQMIGEGSVGPEFSSLFTMFINNKLDKIIAPQDVITNPNEAYVLGALSSAIGKDDEYRADIASVLATRLVNYSLIHASKEPVSAPMIQRLVKLTTDCEAFTNDLKYYMVKEIVNGNKVKFGGMMRDTTVVKMTLQ